MILRELTEQSHQIWQSIAASQVESRASIFWHWCQVVVIAQKEDGFSIRDAARLILWPPFLDNLKGLGDVAEILLVTDAADAIVEGDAYIGVPDNESRDWAILAARVGRHAGPLV